MSTEIEKTTENNELEYIKTALKNLRWPSSRPGPMVKQPPPGLKHLPTRTEQVVAIDYDQERGRSNV
jgi:hypothetical protein